MRSAIILGATGSIGNTALKAIRDKRLPIIIKGLVANSSAEKLATWGAEFNAPTLLMKDHTRADLKAFLINNKADIVLNGIAGADGLFASLASIEAGSDLALANKESIVMGGDFLFSYAKEHQVKIIPVDSEHSAIYHLMANLKEKPSHLIITASGGPFLHQKDTSTVTPSEAIKHPTWKMGPKISIDSATLANKGLEVIEAGFLFSMPADKIEVTIHPQSIVHSMIQMDSGPIYAQLSPPDMTYPIISALDDEHFPLEDIVKRLDFSALTLNFSAWDRNQFPLLSLAYQVLERKGSYPIAFNAADEVAVQSFISGQIGFNQINEIVQRTLESDWTLPSCDFASIEETDKLVRILSRQIIAHDI